ncbi:hypothetical protein ACFQFH_07875 [Halobaculum halobium]|uniref:Membrane associated serine protease, rhomboid family n=1 Tax=Halobaculum halobium TaxID=3032281 RepID=A0ABD5T993_9EURY|nr:hypothetical protein [Halobaculum sp. SYNS20]
MNDAPDSFRATLRKRVRLADCLGLAAVPAVLVAVFLLPAETKLEYVFTYERPTLLTAYAAHFVHRSLSHLLSNVFGYALLAGTGYVLAVLADARRLFFVATATYLLAFPPALSALNLAVPRDAVGYGFSGVTMAFVGLLVILLAAYAERRIHPEVSVDHAPVGFLALLALVSVLLPTHSAVATALAGTAALGALGYAAMVAVDVRGTAFHSTARGSGWLELFAFGAVLVLGYPFVGFPAELGTGVAVVNVYVHFLGLSLAFLVAFVAVLVDAVPVADE